MWYKNLDRSFFHFVTIHACDGQTDRILNAIPRLHYMQCGKNDSLTLFITNSVHNPNPDGLSLTLAQY